MLAMYRLARVDVELNVRKVCEMVLQDQEVDRKVRKTRAQGLKLLGMIWRDTPAPEEPKSFVPGASEGDAAGSTGDAAGTGSKSETTEQSTDTSPTSPPSYVEPPERVPSPTLDALD